jgi:hypothetical protein
MIAYELVRKKPESFAGRVREALGFSVDPTKPVLDAERLARQVALADGEPIPHTAPPEPHGSRYKPQNTTSPLWMPAAAKKSTDVCFSDTALGMGKEGYARWLNQFVYSKFPKGTLVTLHSEAFVLNQPPRIWFEVIEIQQIHYMAEIDKKSRSPKAVGLKTGKHDIPMWYAPGHLRVLQPEEVAAVDRLRNQQAENDGFATITIDTSANAAPENGARSNGGSENSLDEASPPEGDI